MSQNRYTYAGNDPVNYADPSGHFFGLIIAAIAVVTVVVAAVVSARKTPAAPAPTSTPRTGSTKPTPTGSGGTKTTGNSGGSGGSSGSSSGGSSGSGYGNGAYRGGGYSSGSGSSSNYYAEQERIRITNLILRYDKSLNPRITVKAGSYASRIKEASKSAPVTIKSANEGAKWWQKGLLGKAINTANDVATNGWKNSALGQKVASGLESIGNGAKKLWNDTKSMVKQTANNVSNWYQENKETIGKVARGALVVLTAALAVTVGVAVVAATGGAAAASILMLGMAGSVANTGGQIVADVTEGITTGDWSVNGWDYLGAAVGGFLGGLAAPFGGTAVGIITGGVTNFISSSAKAFVEQDATVKVLRETAGGALLGGFFGHSFDRAGRAASNLLYHVSEPLADMSTRMFFDQIGTGFMQETPQAIFEGLT